MTVRREKKLCGGIGTVCVTLLLSNAIRLLTKRQEQNDTAILRTTPRRMQTPPSISSQNSWNVKIIVKENKKRKRNQRLPFSHVRFRSINLFVSYKQLHCVFFSYLFLFVSFLFPPFERLRYIWCSNWEEPPLLLLMFAFIRGSCCLFFVKITKKNEKKGYNHNTWNNKNMCIAFIVLKIRHDSLALRWCVRDNIFGLFFREKVERFYIGLQWRRLGNESKICECNR